MPIPGGRNIEVEVGGGAKEGNFTGGGAGTEMLAGREGGSNGVATGGGSGTDTVV